MANFVRVAGIDPESIVDGPGLRGTLFVQGCRKHCPGCHNKQTWPMRDGKRMLVDTVCKELFVMDSLLRGITLSGGEPLLQPKPLSTIAWRARQRGLDVLLFTGWTAEEVRSALNEKTAGLRKLMECVDMMVTGPFVDRLRSLDLRWRGSSNQELWKLHSADNWERVEDFE